MRRKFCNQEGFSYPKKSLVPPMPFDFVRLFHELTHDRGYLDQEFNSGVMSVEEYEASLKHIETCTAPPKEMI